MAAPGSAQYLGHVVPVTFDPTLLVLSYVISFIGAASTLELINRRTSRKGYYNNLLLLGASVTMGGVAIWSMHYIGNSATILLGGEPDLQIAYSVRVTVASFFVPILVLLLAFFVVTGTGNQNDEVNWWRLGASGTLSGGAICGMHYLGNASISNYHCEYAAANVAGAAIIAVAASTIALSLFFVFRSAWTSSWWKRIGCAFLLAGAVSGMHWSAATGTTYVLTQLSPAGASGPRHTTAVVVSCLASAACLTIAGTAIYSARVRKGYARRAQRITLAAAVFDRQGRILVNPDGLLPSEVVTSTFLQKAHHETFTTGHPLFQWIFQASRNWATISSLLEKMNQHLASLPRRGRNVRTGIELVDEEGHVIDHYDTIFCELFCLAAASLAHKMNERIVDAGFLWNEILTTGGQGHGALESIGEASAAVQGEGSVAATKRDPDDLAERGVIPTRRHGHGYLMFLVRRVDNDGTADRLTASGYRFADPRQVSHIISSNMQIRASNLEQKLRGMEQYARGTMLEPGVHVGLFAVRTKVHQGGFEVLVRRQARNLLPSVELPLDRLEPAHIALLRDLDGMSLGAVLQRLGRASRLAPGNAAFGTQLYDGIRRLKRLVEDPVVDSAKLVAKVAQIPCAPGPGRPSACSFIAFTIMIPIHVGVTAPTCEFIPLSFFRTQQLVYENSPHNAAFARSVHRRISPAQDAAFARPANTLRRSTGIQGFVSALGPRVLSRFRRHVSRTGARATGQGHQWLGRADKLVSSSREQITLTPCDESALPETIYARNGGDLELEHDSDAPAEPTPSPDEDPPRRTGTPSAPRQHAPKASLGGIMISQEVMIDVEEGKDSIAMVPATSMPPKPQDFPDGHGRQAGLTHQKSQGGLRTAGGRSTPIPPSYDRAAEAHDVSAVLGIGLSKVEIKKEGDAVTTFVDDLFASCIGTSTQRSP